jgi:hypothetical protein
MVFDKIFGVFNNILKNISCCFFNYIDFFFRNVLCLTFLKMLQFEGLVKVSSKIFFYMFLQVKLYKFHPIKC